jgi:putative transposase
MKGKRYTTEEKIRILLVAEWSEKSVPEICREQNISEVSFHRWKRQFGHMEVNEARRLKELERENTELKKMLAEEMLKNRVLAYVCEKSCEPGRSPGARAGIEGHSRQNHLRPLRRRGAGYRTAQGAAVPKDIPGRAHPCWHT